MIIGYIGENKRNIYEILGSIYNIEFIDGQSS